MSEQQAEGFLDSNIVVRYLVQDLPEQAEDAARIIESGRGLLLTEGTLAEIGYVLTKIYRIQREAVVDSLIAVVRRRNIAVHRLEKDLVIQALQLCRPSSRVSFVDALLWAVAHSSGIRAVYTFDARFPRHGLQIRPGITE